MSQYKVCLLGNGGVGKSTWVKQLLLKMFDSRYNPTMGVEVFSFEFENDVFNFWDCAGQQKYGGLKDGFYILADAAIIFHDVSSEAMNFKPASKNWERDFKRVCEESPVLHVITKSELLSLETKNEILQKYPNVIFISSITNENLLEPIKKLLIQLKN